MEIEEEEEEEKEEEKEIEEDSVYQILPASLTSVSSRLFQALAAGYVSPLLSSPPTHPPILFSLLHIHLPTDL